MADSSDEDIQNDMLDDDDESSVNEDAKEMERDPNDKRRRPRKYLEDDDDWFGGDFSCCFCLPIDVGIKTSAGWSLINWLLLIWQINGVTDDGSS